MNRKINCFLLTASYIAVAHGVAFARTAKELYAAGFGAEDAAVRAARDPQKCASYARELMDAADDCRDEATYQAFLYNKAYEFGMLYPASGAALSIEAMEKLSQASPETKAACDEKWLAALKTEVDSADNAGRPEALKAFVEKARETATELAAAAKYDDAIRVCDGALRSSGELRPRVQACKETIVNEKSTAKTAADLEADLKANPGRKDESTKLVKLLVLRQDRPELAVEYLPATGDEKLTSMVPLAVRGPANLNEQELKDLGDWYYSQVSNADKFSSKVALSWARVCYERFLAMHAMQDGEYANVTHQLNDALGKLEKLKENDGGLAPAAPADGSFPGIWSVKNSIGGHWQHAFFADGTAIASNLSKGTWKQTGDNIVVTWDNNAVNTWKPPRLDGTMNGFEKYNGGQATMSATRIAGARPAAGQIHQIKNSIGMKLVEIKPNAFNMGSPAGEAGRHDDEQLHRVVLTKTFYMGCTDVTVGEYTQFETATNFQTEAERLKWGNVYDDVGHKWTRVNGISFRQPGYNQTANYPACFISWNEANAFCSWLSRKEARHYRLPSEAEWEYACRAGTTSAFNTGVDPLAFSTGSWEDHHVHPVAQKKPNAWGLYDMHGDLRQWCCDWYEKNPAPDLFDPLGVQGEKNNPVTRGGDFRDDRNGRRSAARFGGDWQGWADRTIGFRVVMEVPDEPQPDAGIPTVIRSTNAETTDLAATPAAAKNTPHTSIVYLCGASGSMIATFGQVQSHLKDLINALDGSAQAFNIVFYHEGKFVALFQDGPKMATADVKKSAMQFVDKETARGPTEVIPAIKFCMDERPDLLCFLSNGFSNAPDTAAVVRAFKDDNAVGRTHVSAILFDKADASEIARMKQIAKEGHGDFKEIGAND